MQKILNDDVIPEIELILGHWDHHFWVQRPFLLKNTYSVGEIAKTSHSKKSFSLTTKNVISSWNLISCPRWRHQGRCSPPQIKFAFFKPCSNDQLWRAITQPNRNIFWCGFFAELVWLCTSILAHKKWGVFEPELPL